MKTRNKSYWIKRTTALEQSIQDGATPSVNKIIRAYERAIDNINGDMRKVFREFSRASGISEEQAAEIISQSESDELYTDLLKLLDETEDAKLRSDIIQKINQQAYGARISRLEALKRKVYIRLKQAQNVEMSQHNALHKETLKSSYYSNIYNIAKGFDVGIDFSLLPDNAIKKVLSEPWLGSNYSKRIWNNNEQFIERVQQTIEDGITGGHSISRMADRLEEYVKVPNQGQRYITERLARSETAHFMAQGQLMSYEEVGIEKYQYVAALAENTCDTCGGLDGETFDVKDARPGDNYPPMHANCRCTTIMAGFTPATRIARDPETGKNYKVDGSMTFEEWKNSLTDEQRASLKYIDKSAGNGIINTGSGKNLMKPDEIIHRSLGAAGKNYPIKLPNGNHAKFAEGTAITNIKIFAGKDTDVPIRDAIYLESEFGIEAKKWQKVRGEGIIMNNGKPCKAEVHWYEAEGQKEKMKVKRWIDDET